MHRKKKKTSRRFPQILTSYMAKFKSFKAEFSGRFPLFLKVRFGGFSLELCPANVHSCLFLFHSWWILQKNTLQIYYSCHCHVPSLTIAVFQGQESGLSSHVKSAELGTYLDTSTLLAICLCWSTCHWYLQDGILGPEICRNGWVMSLQVT